MQQARSAVSAQATLDTLIARREKLGADLASFDAQQQQLKTGLEELGNEQELNEVVRVFRERLPVLDAELAAAREAGIKYAQIEPLRVHLTELKDEGVAETKGVRR